MKRLTYVLFLTILAATGAISQITWTYSTRDALGYATGDSLNAHPKWRKLIDTSSASPNRKLVGGTAGGSQGQAILGSSSLGSGARAGAFWDSTMQSDTCSFQYVWKQNEDSQYVSVGSAWFYFGMSDSNISKWKGLALRMDRQNLGAGSPNGGDYVSSFRRIDSLVDQPTVGAYQTFPGGFAIRQNDTIRVVNLGGNMWAYWCKAGGAGTVLIDSTPYSASNAAWANATGRMAIRMRVSPSPPMINTFMIGTKSGSAPVGVLRDSIPPAFYGETQSFSLDNLSTFTLSFGAYDSNTTTQKSPGMDSMIIKFGTSFAAGVGGAPDTVIGDSSLVKCGTTKDTVISKLFSAKAIGTYYFQFKGRDDTGNVKLGSRKTLVVGTVVQNPFKVMGYFYTQTLSSWWPAVSSTPSLLGDLAANSDITYWFYDNPDTLAPYLRLRVPDQGNAQYPAGSMAADSLRFFGLTASSNTRNIMYQFRDSIHAHGNKIAICISAITAFAPATAVLLQIIVNDTTKSKGFAQTMGKFCNLHKLDGVDFNWEFPITSNKANMFQFFKKMKDSLTAYSWNGQPPLLSLDLETQTSVVGNQRYDFSALDSLCTHVSVVSRSRFSGAGNAYTSNPAGVTHPTNNISYSIPGDTVKGFDGYTSGDTTYQFVPQYITVNGLRAGGIRASKDVQVLGFGAYEHYLGVSGAGQAAANITSFTQLGESNGGSAAQTYMDQYWSPLREWRDSTNNHYLGYKDASNVKHTVIYDDSVSLGELVKMLKARGFSAIMYNEAAWLQNSSGWRGNNDRLSFLHWMRAAANTPSFSTVGMPTPTSPAIASTGQGNASAGTVAVNFKWNKVANASEGYHISVCADNKFNTAVTGGDVDVGSTTTDTSVTISGLAPSTVHYWKVTGRMGRFYGYYSKVQTFTTATATSSPVVKPHKPLVVYPSDLATGIGTSLTFKWHQPSGITDTVASYYFQVGVDPTFTAYTKYDSVVSSQQGVNADTQYIVTGLAQAATYYWHVKSRNAMGDSGYTANVSFTTANPVVSVPSFKKTFRYFDDVTLSFKNDAPPPMLMKDFALGVVFPPRKANGTLDTGTAWFTPRGVVFWDSTVYDFSKAGNYLLGLGNTWTATQNLSGGATIGNLSVTGSLVSNITPTNSSTNVGLWNLGTAANPMNTIYSNNDYKVFLRNGSYTTDQYAIRSEQLLPNSGVLLWEDFMFNGNAAISLAIGTSAASAVGQNRFSVFSYSQTAAGGGIQYLTPTVAAADSNEPGMMALNLQGCGTLGTANGGAFSFKGSTTFGNVNPRINGLIISGKFFIPVTADSLGIAAGLSATTDTLGFVTTDSAKAGLWIETGGRLTAAQQVTDSICAVSSAGGTGTRTKVKLITAISGLWYAYQIAVYGGGVTYTVWSSLDNFTTPTSTTIVSNLPANPTNTSPFLSAWNYDKSTSKQVRFGFYGLFLSNVKRGGF